MSINIFREYLDGRKFLGSIVYDNSGNGTFFYDGEYIEEACLNGELGISERLPVKANSYSRNEFDSFFRGLLPEGDVLTNISRSYQTPQSNYLELLEKMGCETIGALTFISSEIDESEYEPRYNSIDAQMLEMIITNPTLAATTAAVDTRLSLAGAQSKVAWYIPREKEASLAVLDDWFVPLGTAASTHIIKISRQGEYEIAENEYACSLLAKACGIETAETVLLKEIPGAIAVKRYDRIWQKSDKQKKVRLIRLHQEDFCQALGLLPYMKYQPSEWRVDYPLLMSNLVLGTCREPAQDLKELAKRILFCYAIGNTDAHLKNFSLLYDLDWRFRSLAPMYDITCIPLTGYSTNMPFKIGEHRKLEEIDERDLALLAMDIDLSLSVFDEIIAELLSKLESPGIDEREESSDSMVDAILENSKPRLDVLRKFIHQM